MFKKYISLIIALCMIMAITPAGVFADNDIVTIDGIKYRYITTDADKNIATVTGYDNIGRDVTVPEKIKVNNNEYEVTGIGAWSFRACSSLTSITLPAGLETIGEGAFYGFKSLENILIPDNLVSIEKSAFYKCSNITEVKIPGSVERIGKRAFSNCTSLKTITFSDGSKLSSIEVGTFSDCKELTSITIPESITGIGDMAFEDSGLTTIIIPSEVADIGCFAFSGCSNLISVIVPNNVKNIGAYAFSDCSNLTDVTIPGNMTSISEGAFSDCENLANIIIPNKIINIESFAFYGCNNLAAVMYEGTEEDWIKVRQGEDIGFTKPDIFINIKLSTKAITQDSITLKALDNLGSEIKARYRINKGNWQESPVFEGLEQDTEYTFEAGYFRGNTQITGPASAVIKTTQKTPSYVPSSPAKPEIDITGEEGGTVTYDKNKHTVTITPNDNYIVKEIYLNGIPVPVTEGTMVLKNIYGGSRISITFEKRQEYVSDIDKYISDLKITARSSKTSEGNIRIKVTSVTDSNGNILDLTELKDRGYTVKFKYYRSVKKSSAYKAKIEKDDNSYTNTNGTKGTKYYYKVRVMIYDADGSLVAKSKLKQCRYASRTWSK